jgi:hypothetical protein
MFFERQSNLLLLPRSHTLFCSSAISQTGARSMVGMLLDRGGDSPNVSEMVARTFEPSTNEHHATPS